MFKIAICEDDKQQQNHIKNLLLTKEYADIQKISTFDSGEEIIDAYRNKQEFAIILLDMQMKELNGIQTAEIIRKYDKKAIIIIVTSIIEYAVEGYSIDAYDFILKPVDEVKFYKIIEKAIKKLKDNLNKVYVIQVRDRVRLIKLSDIIYFESDGKKIEVYCADETLANNENISVIEKRLVDDGFVRISRFYLLNMVHIKEIRIEDILLKNGKILRYSDKLQKSIKERYMNFMMGDL